MRLSKCSQYGDVDLHSHGKGEADAQSEVVACGASGCVGGGVHLREHLADALVEDLARRSEPRSAGAPDQELHPEFALQVTDLLTECRLRHMETCGSSGEAVLFRDGHKISEMA
jgi:hypothetical protein